MRYYLVRTVLIFALCVLTVEVYSMEESFRGSADEVEDDLYSIFPLGEKKDIVISTAKSKLGLEESEFRSHDYGNSPLILEHNENNLDVYSWIEMDVAEYRSIKNLFIKTTVTAKLFFDEEEKLIGVDVTLYGDSL